MRVFNRKSVTVVATGTLVMVGAGVAFAYWTANGEGSGTAATAEGTSFSIAQLETISNLRPGDSPQPVTARVTNDSGDQRAQLTSVHAWLTVAGADGPNCDADDYLLGGESTAVEATPVALRVTPVELAPLGSADATTTIQFHNKANENQDDCKGAVVTIHYAAA